MNYIKYWSNAEKVEIINEDQKLESTDVCEQLEDSFHIITDQPPMKSVDENIFIMYSVTKEDTIERVAAKYKMTPNELISLNKMHSRTLFINQKLKVKKNDEEENESKSTISGGNTSDLKNSTIVKKMADSLSDSMFLPLHYKENHLKVVSRYITDSQGIINGKILLTHTFFTFIPSLSDPVVMEYGDENYTIHLQNIKIECVSMYNDSNVMAYMRSQRADMANNFTSSTNIDSINVDIKDKGEGGGGEELESSLHISPNTSSISDNCLRDHTKFDSLNDVLGRSVYVNDIERLQNSKFFDHKYLCVVASPRYRNIKSESPKEDEYWFMVPTSSAQSLMDYFLTEAPTKCDNGADIELLPDENKAETLISSTSFAKVEDVVGPLLPITNKFECAIKTLRSKSIDWEIVNVDVDCRFNLYDESEEVDSRILDSAKVKELMKHLPSETVGATWELIYSTNRDGWSLNTLYRNVYNSTRGCCLLLIGDSNSMVFGAMCNSYIRMSSSFYGNGTTFVFRWSPHFEKFSYAHRNNFILFGQPDFFSVGCSNCKNAIRIEKDLFSGVTQQCDTFDSPPLVSPEVFNVLHLEVWSFY